MSRIDKITEDIENYASDSFMDGYHAGYDEAWDEALDKGHDDGYQHGYQQALDNVMEMVNRTGWVMTPESREECTSMIESFQDNGLMSVMLYMNYLAAQIKSLEE